MYGGDTTISTGGKKVWRGAQLEALKASQQSEDLRLRNEAKTEAAERKRKALEEAERRRREEAEARRRAVEAETKRLLLEEEDRLREERAKAWRREEAEVAKRVVQRREMEESTERKLKEEMEAKRKQVAEELKKKIKEDKIKKFEHGSNERRRPASMYGPVKITQRDVNSNPIVSRFEGIASYNKAGEKMLQEKMQATRNKKHVVVPPPPPPQARDKIRTSAQKLASVIGKKANRGWKGESDNRPRPTALSWKRNDAENVREEVSKDFLAAVQTQLGKSKSSQRLDEQEKSKKRSMGQMQSYLISNVLFDGEEEVMVQSKKEKDPETKQKEEEELFERERAMREYQEDMERYLSTFGEPKKFGPVRKESRTDEIGKRLSRKPVIKLDDLKGRFENGDSDQSGSPKSNGSNNVGKLKVNEFFPERSVNEKKSDYVPVIIDSDAFSRTMNKFEDYRQEEDEREKRKEEVVAKAEAKKKLKEERIKRMEEELERRKLADERMKEEKREQELKTEIMEELARLKEQEEMQRKRLEMENRKKDLKNKAHQEVDCMKSNEVKKTDEEEEVPKWIKLASDVKERKAYISEKHPELLEKKPLILPGSEFRNQGSCESSSDSFDSLVQRRASCRREDSDTFDAEMKAMIEALDEDEAKALVKELDLEEEEEPVEVYSAKGEAEMPETESEMLSDLTAEQEQRRRQLTSNDDSIDEMLQLLGEDECAQLAEELSLCENAGGKKKVQIKRPKAKQKASVPLIDMSKVKSNLLQPKDATSPVSPPPKVSLANVSRAKEMLLNKLTGGDKKAAPPIKKVGKINKLSIKKTFDKSNEQTPQRPVVRKQKAIIEIPVPPSIEQQLEQAKAKNKTKKWSYQDIKQIKPAAANERTSQISRQTEVQFESTGSRGNESAVVSSLKENFPDDRDEFISGVYNYIKSAKSADESGNLKGLVSSYLELSKRRKDKEKKELAFDYVPNTDQIKRRLISKQQEENKSKPAVKAVGKIKDPDALLKSFRGEEEESAALKKSNSVDSYACQSLKDKYEKLEREKVDSSSLGMSRERQRAIQQKIWGADNVTDKQPQLQTTTQRVEMPNRKPLKEWKWKKKLEDAAKFAAMNKDNRADADKKAPSKPVVAARTSEDIEKLQENRRIAMENAQRREEEFQKLMDELQELKAQSAEPSTKDFDSVLNAYLDAVDQSESRYNAALPKLSAPLKVKSIKSKIEGGGSGAKANGEAAKKKKVVGKISTDFERQISDEARADQKREKDPALEILQTDRIKRLFESNKDKKSEKGRIKPEKVWEPPPKKTDDKAVAQKKTYKFQLKANQSSGGHSTVPPPPPPSAPKKPVAQRPARSEWEHIDDPDEKKKAILAKYGFKPREPKDHDDDDDALDALDTIPSHVLKDEILYQRYMREHLELDDSSDELSDGASDSSLSLPSPTPTRKSSAGRGGKTSSSFRKVLGNFKKIQSGKAPPRKSKSSMDLSSVPGSCHSLKSKFDASFGNLFGRSGKEEDFEGKQKSCSDLKKLWEQKFNPSAQKKQPAKPQGKKLTLAGRHIENMKNKLKNGEDATSVVKKFFDREKQVSSSNGEYVKRAKEAISLSQQSSRSDADFEPDAFKSEAVANVLRLLQEGKLSEEQCREQLDDAERGLRSRYFEGLCHSANSEAEREARIAELQRELDTLMAPTSQEGGGGGGGGGGGMDGDDGGGSSEWHRKNYEEQKNRIAAELDALKKGSSSSIAAMRGDLQRMWAGSSGAGSGQGRNHLDVAASGSGAVRNLKGQLVRQMSNPPSSSGAPPQRQQSSRDAMQERARQLFLENCNELQQMNSKQQPAMPRGAGNIDALRGKLSSNMSGSNHGQQPRPPPRKMSTGNQIHFQQQQQPNQHPKSYHSPPSQQNISQLQDRLAASLLENPAGAEVVYSPSASSSDAVATVRERLETLFDGKSEEWNKIFPSDCDSCSNLRKTLEDNLKKTKPGGQQQHTTAHQHRQGPPSKAVGSAQKGLIKLMNNDYDQSSSAKKVAFNPVNKGSISERQKQLFSPQQQQQKQQSYPRKTSKDMGLKKDVIENLFAADRINNQMGNKAGFGPSNQRCNEVKQALQTQLQPMKNLQFCRPQPPERRDGGSHGLAATKNKLDSFFAGGSRDDKVAPFYRQPPPRTKSLGDVKNFLQRQMEGGGNEDNYKNDYGVLDSVRSDRVRALRRQMSDRFSAGHQNQRQPVGGGKSFPRSRSTCDSLRGALERQQTADSSYVPYSPEDCPRSESVASLRNRLNSMWDSSDDSRPGSRQAFHGLQQTKSCSNIRHALQEQWEQSSRPYGGRQVAVVAPSVSVSNMKNLFDSSYSSLPQSDGSMDAALTLAARDPARRRAFEDMMRVLESGASTLQDQGARNAVYSELENLRRTLALRSLEEAPGADHDSFDQRRQELRQELDEVRAARGAIDKNLLARLVSGEERRLQGGAGMRAELDAVRASRKATGAEEANAWHQNNYQEQKDKIQLELEALRGRVKASLLKIEQGGSTIDRDKLEAELEAVRSARQRYHLLESELRSGRSGGFTERQRIQNELAALRESRKGSSLNKINFGSGGGVKRSGSASDLDAEAMRDLKRSNARVKAMFEADAPKYRFGGSGERMLQADEGEEDELMLRPRRPRGAQQQQQQQQSGPREERKWVADTINKYFDVIVEEDEDEARSSQRASRSQNQLTDEYDEDDENQEIFYPDSDDDEDEVMLDRLGKGEEFKSTSNIRGLLGQVMRKVSKTNAGASKEALVGALKQNLGSQIPPGTDM